MSTIQMLIADREQGQEALLTVCFSVVVSPKKQSTRFRVANLGLQNSWRFLVCACDRWIWGGGELSGEMISLQNFCFSQSLW